MLPISMCPAPTIKEPRTVRIAAVIRAWSVAAIGARSAAATGVRIAASIGMRNVAAARDAAAPGSMCSSARSWSVNTMSGETARVGIRRTAHPATQSPDGPPIRFPPDTKNRDLHSPPILAMPAYGGRHLATVMNSSRGGRRRTSVYRALIITAIPNRGTHVLPPDNRCRQRCDQESAAALTAS